MSALEPQNPCGAMNPVEAVQTRIWRGPVRDPTGDLECEARVEFPPQSHGLVIFVHPRIEESGETARLRQLAGALHEAGFATLHCDLTADLERRLEAIEERSHSVDIRLLVSRLRMLTDWAIVRNSETATLRVGYLAVGAGAAAAMILDTEDETDVGAIVAIEGRVDLAVHALSRVRAPTLLIVAGEDCVEIPLQEEALEKLHCPRRLEVVPDADAAFADPEAWRKVVDATMRWFGEHLPAQVWRP